MCFCNDIKIGAVKSQQDIKFTIAAGFHEQQKNVHTYNDDENKPNGIFDI